MVQPCPTKPVSTTDSAVSYRSSLRVDVKILLFLAAASLIPHPQLGKTQSLLAETQKAPFCCCSSTPTKWWFWKARISEDDVSNPRQLILLQLPTSSSCEIHVNRREEGAIREAQSHVPIILSHICRARKLESKHKSMPTKRELYQRSNYFHIMGKLLADRKELCSPLHAFTWLLLVMQEGKKKNYFQRFTGQLKPHITSENADVLTLAWDPEGLC